MDRHTPGYCGKSWRDYRITEKRLNKLHKRIDGYLTEQEYNVILLVFVHGNNPKNMDMDFNKICQILRKGIRGLLILNTRRKNMTNYY